MNIVYSMHWSKKMESATFVSLWFLFWFSFCWWGLFKLLMMPVSFVAVLLVGGFRGCLCYCICRLSLNFLPGSCPLPLVSLVFVFGLLVIACCTGIYARSSLYHVIEYVVFNSYIKNKNKNNTHLVRLSWAVLLN